MKIIHLADLHLGKKVNKFSMIEDQKYILQKILEIVEQKNPDVIIIAGDVYDKSIPSVEAVELLDEFMTEIAKKNINTFIVSGNHDSAERLSFGSKFMEMGKIYISRAYDGKTIKFALEDENGEINFYLLPFIKPIHVKKYFPDEKIENYTQAINIVIKNMNIDKTKRNILIAHQFVTGASRTESEEITIGGLDNVEASVFFDFDYVALGHIHRPQNIENKRIRYCGTPLKYSFSEVDDKKSVSIIEINSKDDLKIETVELVPIRDMRKIKGSYDEITKKSNYENTNIDDYVSITLTDEEDIPDAIQKLRVIYKNIMKLEYDNTRTRNISEIDFEIEVNEKSPFEIFSEFFEMQNGKKMEKEQEKIIIELMEKIWE